MLVTLVDDSIPFDGHTPATRPLGGPEKAVAALAAALSKRGHTVRVYNRCEHPTVVEGVSWLPLDTCEAAHSDWLIAHRDPALLDTVPHADRRALWLAGAGDYLADSQAQSVIKRLKPVLVLQGLQHSPTVPSPLQSMRSGVIVFGVNDAYREAGEMVPATPPRAVVTTHPRWDLAWLVELWVNAIAPRVPGAELHVYSALLARAGAGAEDLPAPVRRARERVVAARDQGVTVLAPAADPEMAEAYRRARAHLYPGHARDILCTTLAESQAVGLPAVARRRGAVTERVIDGQTGYVVGDDEAFANVAVELLVNDQTFAQLSDKARELQRQRGWDSVARDFEMLLQ